MLNLADDMLLKGVIYLSAHKSTWLCIIIIIVIQYLHVKRPLKYKAREMLVQTNREIIQNEQINQASDSF